MKHLLPSSDKMQCDNDTLVCTEYVSAANPDACLLFDFKETFEVGWLVDAVDQTKTNDLLFLRFYSSF